MFRNFLRFLGVSLGVLLLSMPAFSQGETGRISGTITDQTGGAVAGAMVTVTDTARGQSRNLATDASGQYAAPNLIPSTYTVQATSAGFQLVQRQNIQVGVGGDIHVDLTLQAGAQTQTVTVTGEAPAMNTTSAQTGGTLENNLIQDLPINGGSYRSIVSVLPGVTKLPGSGVDDQSTNGGGTEWDNYMLDGLYDVSVWANQATVGSITSSGDTTLLPLDAIQEINLVSNPKAEFGYYPGTTVDVGLKSGTNDIHGSAWAFGRGTAFDARNPFTPESQGRAPTEFEQFGAVIGGPIKKNKLFYFGAFEGALYQVGFPLITTAPTLAQGHGASTSIPDAIAGINVVNPALLSELSANIAGCDFRNGNIHSTSAATVALACQNKNQFGQPGLWRNTGPNNQLPESFFDSGNSNSGLVKVDYKVSEHHSFNAEFYMGDSFDQLPPVSGNSALAAASTQPWWENVFDVYTRTGRVVEIWTPNSNWLNEARVGYDFQDQPNYNSECQNTATLGHAGGPASYATTYGLVSGADVINGQQGCGFPTISISGFQAKLNNTSLRQGGGRDLQLADNVSYSRGKHQFKWGYNLRKQCLCLESKNGTAGFGNLAFGASGFAAFAAGDVNTPGATSTATPLQDFLAGDLSSEQILPAVASIRNIHYNMMAAFIQDDWRVTSRLTLNLGFRWEGETPARDSGGQLGNFDPTAPSGMVQSNQLWPFQSGPTPHVGLAWDLTGKGTTVVRAGGSIAYVYQSMINWTSLASDAPQAMPTGATLFRADGSTLQGPGNIVTFLANSQPITDASGVVTTPLSWTAGSAIFTPNSFVAQCGNGLKSTSSASINPGTCTLYGAYPSYKLPYVSTWNLSVQHAFTSNLTLNVAYVGTHGTALNLQGDINAPTPGISGGKNELQRRVFYNAANNSFGDNYTWFGPAVFDFNGGRSDYNALQLTLAERVSHGLSFTAGYTFSHALGSGSAANASVMNIGDLHSEYGNMPIDFRHRFTLTTTYALPGRKAPLQLLEGWSVVSNLTLMSPPAITAASATTFDVSGTGVGLDRWNITGDPANFSKAIGGPSPAPCYGLPSSKFAVTGCTIVASGAAGSLVGTPAFVANMPAACIAGAMADSTSNGGAWNLANNNTVPVQSTTSLSTSSGYNGLAQLAELGCYFVNGTAITPPAQGTFGDMAPGMLRPGAGGGFRVWDLAVHKDWKFKERYTTQFRAEWFNVTNEVNYFLPSTALASPGQFGESFSTPDIGKGVPVTGLGGPREMQLALKLIW